jgi:hypothetical protein
MQRICLAADSEKYLNLWMNRYLDEIFENIKMHKVERMKINYQKKVENDDIGDVFARRE